MKKLVALAVFLILVMASHIRAAIYITTWSGSLEKLELYTYHYKSGDSENKKFSIALISTRTIRYTIELHYSIGAFDFLADIAPCWAHSEVFVAVNGRVVWRDEVSTSNYRPFVEHWRFSRIVSGTIVASSLTVVIGEKVWFEKYGGGTSGYAYAHVYDYSIKAEYPDVVQVSASEGGSVNPSGRLEVWGNYLAVKATPSPGYEFEEWEVSGGITVLDSSASGRFRVKGDGSIRAIFRKVEPKKYRLTIGVRPSGAGTTSPSPGAYYYEAESRVIVRAFARTGYRFSYWLLDGVKAGSSPSIAVVMDRNHALVAVFEKLSRTFTYYVDHYRRVKVVRKTYYISSWTSTPIYWPLAGEKSEGKLAPSEYFGIRVSITVDHREKVYGTYDIFLYRERRNTSDPRLAGRRYKVIDYAETRLVSATPISYTIEVTVPNSWAWYIDLSSGQPRPIDETRALRVSDSKSSSGTFNYDLGRWAVKRDVIPVGGYGDFPYTVKVNREAREFRARVSAIRAELEARYNEEGVNATILFKWCDDGALVLGRRYLSAVLEYGDFRKVSSISAGDGLARMQLSWLELQFDAIRANITLTPLIEKGEPVPQSPSTTVVYQDVALVVYENSATALKVRVVRWGDLTPVEGALVILWAEGTDRALEALTNAQGFATLNKSSLLRNLSEYEIWAKAHPALTRNEILNPERYAKILVDKQPPT